jgi:hypothetical protein
VGTEFFYLDIKTTEITESTEGLRPCSLISVSSMLSMVFKNLFLTYFGIDAVVGRALSVDSRFQIWHVHKVDFPIEWEAPVNLKSP